MVIIGKDYRELGRDADGNIGVFLPSRKRICMLYFEMQPDPAWDEIVDTALELEHDLLSEDEDMTVYYPPQISRAFTSAELREEITKLMQAHRSETLFQPTQYHWVILYTVIQSKVFTHNDGEPVFDGLRVQEIDFDALTDIYFWDLDFLIPIDKLDAMSMESKEILGLHPETFGVVSGFKPHPSELELQPIDIPGDWVSPNLIYMEGEDYPYWGNVNLDEDIE